MGRRMNWDKNDSKWKTTGRTSPRELPPTAAQVNLVNMLCRELGIKRKKPRNMQEASELIQSLKESKKKGVKPKARRPAVPINGKIRSQ